MEPASIRMPVFEAPKIAESSLTQIPPCSESSKSSNSEGAHQPNSSHEIHTTTTTTPVTGTIKPNENVPCASFQVYLNSSEIKASRASMWPSTYDIRTLNIFEADKKVGEGMAANWSSGTLYLLLFPSFSFLKTFHSNRVI